MAKTALIIGGTGLIGQALVSHLDKKGWEVTVISRGRRPSPTNSARHVVLDRADTEGLRQIAAKGFDAIFDIVAMSAAEATQLTTLSDQTGTLIVVSSAAVYADEKGDSILNSTRDRPVPIAETHSTVAPVDELNYPASKSNVERIVLEGSTCPVTVIRPGAIYGPGDLASREWHFVKRALDNRPWIVLAFHGRSVFHQVSSINVAALAGLAAEQPGTRTLNVGDEHPRTVLETARLIAREMGHERAEYLIDAPLDGGVGETPWSTPQPLALDLRAAKELGFEAQSPEQTIATTCRWLTTTVADADWKEALPKAAKYYGDLFDYETEDRFVATIPRSPTR